MTHKPPTILILDAPPAPAAIELDVYRAQGIEVRLVEAAALDEAGLEAELARAAVIQTWRAPLPAGLLQRARGCLLVVRYGPGVAPAAPVVDLEAARGLGIYVTSIPDYASGEWAGRALELIVAALGERGQEPARLRLGLVGLGRVGLELALRARALGMDLWAHDPFAARDAFENHQVRPAPLDELLGIAHVVSLHVPLGMTSAGMLSPSRLALMRRDAVLVNVSAPELIDLTGLAAALGRGRPALATFDDDLSQILPAEHPLLARPELRHGPRRAGTGRAAAESLRRRVAEVVVHLLRGQRPAHLQIDPPCPRHILQLAGQSWSGGL